MSDQRKNTIWWLKPLLAVIAVLVLLFIGVKISTVIWDRYLDPDRTTQTAEGESLSDVTLPVIDPGHITVPETKQSSETASAPASTDGPQDTPETDTEYTGALQVPYTRAPGKYILTNEDFGIPLYKSPHDANGDGIDDQTQFVLGAKEFLAKNPQYSGSSYYQGGYPFERDGVLMGVCTDVIGFAFKAAGYDLKALIDADMEAHPENYIRITENFDKNINFRRVKNQYCFFKNHAVELTTDLTKIEEWQPGDIVVTGDVYASQAHICLVSTRRAEDGIPYVLQLATTGQTLFEEDYLTTCQFSTKPKPILAHFRYDGFNGD